MAMPDMAWELESAAAEDVTSALRGLLEKWILTLNLSGHHLHVVTTRKQFTQRTGRRINPRAAGCYLFIPRGPRHEILINVERIELSRPRALEIVVVEELVHMRDAVDGDHRRHAHHGHDRIAYRVADLVGVSLEELRVVFRPLPRTGYRYIYACPRCGRRVPRKRKGRWACRSCGRGVWNPRYQLEIVAYLDPNLELPIS